MPKSFHEIVDKINSDTFENAAMIEESTILQFLDNCKLHQIGSSLIDVYHGFAFPKSKEIMYRSL